jgi:hypothetical protein
MSFNEKLVLFSLNYVKSKQPFLNSHRRVVEIQKHRELLYGYRVYTDMSETSANRCVQAKPRNSSLGGPQRFADAPKCSSSSACQQWAS